MRILYVSTHYGKAGGGGIVAEGLSRALRNRDHVVTNVYLEKATRFRCRVMPYLMFFKIVYNAFRHDVVFSHFHTFTHTTIVSYVCARLARKPIIARIDDYFYTTEHGWFRLLEMGLQNGILKRCNRVFTVSEDYARRIPIDNIGVLRNGVDLDLFNPRLYKISGSAKARSVIFLGVAYAHRGIKKLIEVAKELPAVSFILLGESEFRDIPSNVKTLRVPHKDVPKFLAMSKVAICSLETNVLNIGSLPTKVAEYIAFNLPIVSWKGSLDSHIPYIPVSNVQELQEAIKRLMGEKFKYNPEFVKQFDWSVIAEKLESVMKELL